MNQIEVTFNRILLRLPDPRDWEIVKRVTGKVEDNGNGEFEMALSTHNMHRILKYFDGPRKPEVVKGREHLNKLTHRLNDYKAGRERLKEIFALERFPVEPNGKFVPYAHQTKIIGGIVNYPYLAVLADCGTGKSGATGRAIEEVLRRGEVRPGKILISAPLSVVHASWVEDMAKFTHLKVGVLWTPLTNKTILGEEKIVIGMCEHTEAPDRVVTRKTKKGTKYFNPTTKVIKDKVTVLDRPQEWIKYQCTWKVGTDLDGRTCTFGPITGQTTQKEDTRKNYVHDQLKTSGSDIFIINHDGVRIYEETLKEHGFEWVIVDESTKIKSPDSLVSHAHVNISWKCKRRNILTGTPNPNGHADLWQQFYFLDRGLTLEPALKDFLYEYFNPIILPGLTAAGKNAVKYAIKGRDAEKALIERVRSVSICLEQRDCLDLPPRNDLLRVVYMTNEQEAAYSSMLEDLAAELRDPKTQRSIQSDAVNVLAKIMKLRQITSGFLTNREGEILHLSNNPKLADLDDFVDELGVEAGSGRCVVAAQFREETKQLESRYKHLGARVIQGGVDALERAEIVREFQNGDSIGMTILQPAAAAHGLTLVRAHHMYRLSLDYNFEYYYQVAKRIERIGQRNPIFIHNSVARFQDGSPTIDEDLLDILEDKNRNRSVLFSHESNIDNAEIAQRLTTNIIQQAEEKGHHGRKHAS